MNEYQLKQIKAIADKGQWLLDEIAAVTYAIEKIADPAFDKLSMCVGKHNSDYNLQKDEKSNNFNVKTMMLISREAVHAELVSYRHDLNVQLEELKLDIKEYEEVSIDE